MHEHKLVYGTFIRSKWQWRLELETVLQQIAALDYIEDSMIVGVVETTTARVLINVPNRKKLI